MAVQRTSQSHLETEESLGPIPLAIQLQESKRCLDGSFSSGSSRSNHLAIDTGDQKEAGEEYSKALSTAKALSIPRFQLQTFQCIIL